MKIIGILVLALGLIAPSCGNNNGTPPPPGGESPLGADARAPSEGASMRLADGSNWRGELTWTMAPAFSDDAFLEMTGTVIIRALDGSIPSSVTGVSFTADMPQHGYGTGSKLPRVTSIDEASGAFKFDKLYFTMTGIWRVRVVATVDGKLDVWSTTVNVQ